MTKMPWLAGPWGGVPALTDLHLHVVAEEEVAQLEVAVDDAVAVQVLAAQDGLPQVVPHLGLAQRLPPLVQLQQRLRGTGGQYRGGGCGTRTSSVLQDAGKGRTGPYPGTPTPAPRPLTLRRQSSSTT